LETFEETTTETPCRLFSADISGCEEMGDASKQKMNDQMSDNCSKVQISGKETDGFLNRNYKKCRNLKKIIHRSLKRIGALKDTSLEKSSQYKSENADIITANPKENYKTSEEMSGFVSLNLDR